MEERLSQSDISSTSPIRGASAEEILQASIEFQSNNASERLRHRTGDMYPSMEELEDFQFDQAPGCVEQVEGREVGSPIIMLRAATAPTAAAAAGYANADDPVIRKMIEEEKILNNALMESVPEATLEGTELDSKPSAQTYLAISNSHPVAEITQHDVHPADMDNGVEAELIGEAPTRPNSIVEAPSAAISATLSDEMVSGAGEDTAEATVLNSNSAGVIPNWSNYNSAEATVLDAAPQQQITWITREEDTNYEEIAVIGRHEAEATVLHISEEIHPSDLEREGVRAELIGRDCSLGGSVNNNPTNDLVHAIPTTELGVTDEHYQTIMESNDMNSDIAVGRAFNVDLNETIIESSKESATTIDLISPVLTLAANAVVTSDNGLQDAVHASPNPIASSDYCEPFVVDQVRPMNLEAEATIVSIVEEFHTADMDNSCAQAEFVGQDPVSVDSTRRPHGIFVNSNHEHIHFTEGYQNTITSDTHATLIAISEENNGPGFQSATIQAECIGPTEPPTPAATSSAVVSAIFDTKQNTCQADAKGEGLEGELSLETQADTETISRMTSHISPMASHDPNEGNANDHTTLHCSNSHVVMASTSSPTMPEPQSEETSPTRARPGNYLLSSIIASTDQEQSNTSNRSRLSNIGSVGARDSHSDRRPSSVTNQNSFDSINQSQRSPHQVFSNVARTTMLKTTSNVIERLFGREGVNTIIGEGFPIMPRTILPWSVFASETTGMWVATLNTNQKALDSNNTIEASKALRAFSVPTEKQAEALARAWSPPRLLPFSDNLLCFICEAQFAVFRRPCHCRNCGVCICSGCTVPWPSKMIPDTYNVKKESIVNICKSCDWLCSAFRVSLLEGDHDRSIAIHATGNINLVTPFANVKGELFYPVHCAILGESISLLKWLVDTHCCPLRSIRISGQDENSSGSFTPILTSRGRSLLSIAMEKENMEILRYLTVEKSMQLANEKGLKVYNLINMLDKALRVSAYSSSSAEENDNNHESQTQELLNDPGATQLTPFSASTEQHIISDEALAYQIAEEQRRESTSEGSVEDECIICFTNSINCVITPCGHQICCMQCSKYISRCPVCGVDCSFIQVFKAN